MLETNKIYLRIVLAACLATTVTASWWDDFTNNLATDLTPLIALFGEQATKQFLSESTSVLDSFLFAMAPLGILTGVVSVIRVCGGPSLRAFIGRAQEGGGVAEAELCSSTSRDVCELYHNGAIVRVFGRPKILEVVFDPSLEINEAGDKRHEPSINLSREYFQKSIKKDTRWKEVGQSPSDDEAENGSPTAENARDKFAPNPNLPLNIGIIKQPPYVYLGAAIIEFLAQASVLVFGAVATYKLRWLKNGNSIDPWAFPFFFAGTTCIRIGIFLCATLVNDSTKERVFERRNENTNPKESPDPILYVVQPGNQVVRDQNFDPFLFSSSTKFPLTNYVTSWKVPPFSDSISWSEQDSGKSQKEIKLFQKPSDELSVLVVTCITVLGFILQFFGLRAMHSAVSLLQLAVTLLMSVIRALLRKQRLSAEQNLFRNRPDEVSGHELDWLALHIGKGANDPRRFWCVTAGIPSQDIQPSPLATTPKYDAAVRPNNQKGLEDIQHGTPVEGGLTFTVDPKSYAEMVYKYRSRLAELTGQSASPKSGLSNAWDSSLVSGRIQAQRLSKVIGDSLAILFAHAKPRNDIEDKEHLPWSLNVAVWECSEKGQTMSTNHGDHSVDIFLRKQDLAWAVDQNQLEAIIGLCSWSIMSNPLTEEEAFGLKISTASEIPIYRVMALGTEDEVERTWREIQFWVEGSIVSPSPMNKIRLLGWHAVDIPKRPSVSTISTIRITLNHIPTICSQDIQEQKALRLEHQVVTKLIDCFEANGLGSRQDAYLVIIPALWKNSCLPRAREAIPTAHRVAEELRKSNKFREAEGVLRWAWGIVSELEDSWWAFGEEGINWMNMQINSWMRSEKDEVIVARYALWSISQLERDDLGSVISRNGRTILSFLSQEGWFEIVKAALEIGSVVDSVDDQGRTPLSYAAEYGHVEIVSILMEASALPITEDSRRRTPLSYAAGGAYTKDVNNRSPLRWAAANSHHDGIKYLVGYRARLDDTDSNECTPLLAALLNNRQRKADRWQTANLLLQMKSNVNILIQHKEAWRWALENGEWACAEFLLENHESKESFGIIVEARPADSHIEIGAQPPFFGPGIRTKVFNGEGEETEATMETIQQVAAGIYDDYFPCEKGFKILHILLDGLQEAATIKEVVKGAVTNEKSGREIIEMLLDQEKLIQITEETVIAAATNEKSGEEFITMLLDQQGEQISITEGSVPLIVKSFDVEVVALLSGRYEEQVWITEEVFEAALRSQYDYKKMVTLLLNQRGENMHITEAVVSLLAEYFDIDSMTLLLDQHGKRAQITEKVLEAAARNERSGEEIMTLLLDRDGGQAQVTEGVLKAAATSRRRTDILRLLFDRRGEQMQITEEVLKSAAGNEPRGEEMIKLFLGQRGEQVQVTEEVQITKEVLKAAAGNDNVGEEMVTLFLDQLGEQAQITEEVMKAAAGNELHGEKTTKLLLDHQGRQAQVTEDILKIAAGNYFQSSRIISLLLNQQEGKVPITEDVLKAAAGNYHHGFTTMSLLLDRQEEVLITEVVLKTAAENNRSGEVIMELLLSRGGDQIQVTEEIVKTLPPDWKGVRARMTQLLEQCRKQAYVKV
ncbi:hypothetical protein V8C37DRAFT_418210 [Trichoderma ceciliae]